MSGREWGVLGVAAAASVAVMGWIIWSEQPPAPPAAEPAAEERSSTALGAGSAPEASDVDPARVATLEEAAAADADDPTAARGARRSVLQRPAVLRGDSVV